MAAVTICSDFGAQENKVCHCFHYFSSTCHEVMGLDAMIFLFWMLSFKPAFHSPLSPSSRGSLVPLHFLHLRWCHLHIWGYWYFIWQSWFQLELHPSGHVTWCTLHVSWISRATICSLGILLYSFWTRPFSTSSSVTSCPAYRFLRR